MSFRRLYLVVYGLVVVQLLILVMPASAAASPRATVTIPALDISQSIKEFPLKNSTWSISAWEKGIGHLAKTGWFDNPTNIVLAGHSIMPNGKPGIFAALDTLTIGDEIILSNGDDERHYQVFDVRVVSSDDIDVVMPTEQEQLTLLTCELGSFDSAHQDYTQRLVVMASRVN